MLAGDDRTLRVALEKLCAMSLYSVLRLCHNGGLRMYSHDVDDPPFVEGSVDGGVGTRQ